MRARTAPGDRAESLPGGERGVGGSLRFASGTEEPAEDSSRDDLDFSTSGGGGGGGEETPDWTEWTASPSTLHDSLREQLLLLGLTERDHVLANLIVDALDDDGFLRLPLEDVAALAPGAAPGEVETALRIVQTLEPSGIAARSLGECLALQLEAMDRDTPGRNIALDVVQNRLSLMAARDNTRLLDALGCSEEELRLAMELIRSLDPRPGSKVGTFEPRAIVPDVIVRKEKKRWLVTVNSAIYPRIRVNQQYADYFRQARDGESALLAQHLQEARWLVRNLEQRFLTIQRVAEAVVARQRNFFEYGDLAMRPLTLREIADELGLHESTVSRATSHKFMATPRGVVAFKRFFSPPARHYERWLVLRHRHKRAAAGVHRRRGPAQPAVRRAADGAARRPRREGRPPHGNQVSPLHAAPRRRLPPSLVQKQASKRARAVPGAARSKAVKGLAAKSAARRLFANR